TPPQKKPTDSTGQGCEMVASTYTFRGYADGPLRRWAPALIPRRVVFEHENERVRNGFMDELSNPRHSTRSVQDYMQNGYLDILMHTIVVRRNCDRVGLKRVAPSDHVDIITKEGSVSRIHGSVVVKVLLVHSPTEKSPVWDLEHVVDPLVHAASPAPVPDPFVTTRYATTSKSSMPRNVSDPTTVPPRRNKLCTPRSST